MMVKRRRWYKYPNVRQSLQNCLFFWFPLPPLPSISLSQYSQFSRRRLPTPSALRPPPSVLRRRYVFLRLLFLRSPVKEGSDSLSNLPDEDSVGISG
ncbi:hypothetical protein SDJN03_19419, partial [Cucurbita argyrosperma subsp. sororia]